MDFALHAALLGAVMGSAILAVSTIYGWTLPSAPAAYGWWAAAFVLETVSKGVLLGGATPMLIELSDVFHGLAAGLILVGARVHANHRLTSDFLALGLVASVGWFFAAAALRRKLGLEDLPLFGIGGVTMLYAAWSFFRVAMGSRSDAKRIAGFCFVAAGLQQMAAPLLHVHPAPATLSFVFSQALSMALAVALTLVVLRRQQGVAESEGQRANLLQSRLVDALGSVQDGVALFDGNDRMVTANARYREFLQPVADVIRPGAKFEEILKYEAERGVVPAAKGREKDWVFDMIADHALQDAAPREMQLWDGRWVSVSVYRTADGGHLRILRDDTNRKQAELALQEGVTWLRGIMDTVLDGIVAMDETGMVLSINPAAGRIFGYGGDEVVGRNVTMLMPDCAVGADGFGATPLAGFGRQVKGRRRDGGLFPLEVSIAEMRQGEMVTYITVVRDITDRKRVEDALVESEQRFRDLAESASDWFWEVDESLNFTFVSGRVRQVLGVGPGFFLGRGFQELGESANSPEQWNEQRMAMGSRLPFRGFVFLHDNRQGCGVKYVEMSGRPVFDLDGLFRGYRGTASDITLIKRHEQDLAAHAALRQAIVDNMAQGVVVFDRDGLLVALNRHARTMLDLVEHEVEPGESTLDSVVLYLSKAGEFGSGRDAVTARKRLSRLRKAPDAVFEHARPNRIVLEVRSNGMPGGGLILTFTDITERKRFEGTLRDAKEAAERGNRSKATFLANISHELRTPLNAIIGFSELMKHQIFGPLEPEVYRNYVVDIHESGMHLLELINDILDMSKAEAGMTDLSESVVDVTGIINSSVRMMMRRAETNQVMLQSNVPDALPYLRADEKRVRQIVLNLMSNAVKFTDEGGKVAISVGESPNGLEIRVSDTGIGMTSEDIERVMEPFVQADTRLSRKYEGTGLGLPLTKALVTAHGGTLVLESAPGLGTTAIVTFPPFRLIHCHEEALAADEVMRRG